MTENSCNLQKEPDAVYNSAFWSARMSGGGAARSAVFSAANSVSQGDGTGAAVEGDRAWVATPAVAEAEGDTALEPKMKWSTVQ